MRPRERPVRYSAFALLLCGLVVLLDAPWSPAQQGQGWFCASDYLITSYWTVSEGFYTGQKIPVYGAAGDLLGYYREDFVAAVQVEGWGKGDGNGNDGRYLGYDYLTDEFYLNDAPLDAYGHPLVAWQTVAVDPQVIRPGSPVDITDLGSNPDVSAAVQEKLLNNIFAANDIGAGVTGHHIDVYVGDQIAADMNETELALYIEGATVCAVAPATGAADTAWPWKARIATPWDYPSEPLTDPEYPELSPDWIGGVEQAIADGANAILDWLGVSDDWRYLYDPPLGADLEEMATRADYVHTRHPGVHYVVYVTPFEYVTPGIDTDHDCQPEALDASLAHNHPDWAQIGIDGRPAVFYGGDESWGEQCVSGIFWIEEGAEDVWITPANPEYRALALEQARRIAATGIDGVWFDVPFLRFDFGANWQRQWPTFDPWAAERFQSETGYSLPSTENWDDPAWRAFVRWRYSLTSGFLADYRAALRTVNPNIVLIIETSVGPGVTATQKGSSTLDLPGVSDLTAHEHSGPWRSQDTHYYMWLRFLADLLFFRHTDRDQPAWLLSYVKAGEPDTLDVARLHAAMVLTAGMNYYTSGNETMAGVPDTEFRRELFHWLAGEEATYYDPGWEPYANVALVYSQQTLDYLDKGSWESELAYHDAFPGMAMMLLESHIPFVILSERELTRLSDYDVAILPLFAAMSSEQAQTIRDYVAGGGTIIATGPTSLYDEEGVQLPDFQLADLFGVHYSEVEPGRVYVNDYGLGRAVFLYSWEPGWVLTPELDYYWSAEPWEGGSPDPAGAEEARQAFLEELFSPAGVEPLLSTTAPKGVILLPFRDGDGLALRALNLQGVDQGDAVPTPLTVDLALKLPAGMDVLGAERLEFLGGWGSQDFSQDGDQVQLSFYLQYHETVELSLGEPQGVSFRVTREGDVYAARAFFCGLNINCFNSDQGADIAEWVPVSETERVEPGDVLALDPDRPFYYRKARYAYARLAVGVVSSAPGFVLGQPSRHKALLALLGTVPVKATTENGPIRPGDLLTSASTPGYAMRCGAPQECEGAIIGKALEPLDSGKGMIKMLVMR